VSIPHASASGTFLLGGDLPVHRLGFGAMRVTGPGIWGEPRDPAVARTVLRRVVELGINLIDTADSYGPHVSERLLGEVLHPYPQDLVIATKGGLVRPGPGIWKSDARPEHLRLALEGSLSRLKVERIDLYQLHSPDSKVPFEDSVGALVDLKREGKIRHIGLSNVDEDELRRARALTPIVSVQNRYSVTDRESEGVLELCEKDGIAFLPWYPLDTGKLASSRSALAKVAKASGATPAQLALAWLLNRSEVMLPIPGTGSLAHLEENQAAAGMKLSDAEAAAIEKAVGSQGARR
jgi:aryl-alcohol dehydrogenase-like predicted oxidoreductase